MQGNGDGTSDEARRLALTDLGRRAMGAVESGSLRVSDETQSMSPILRGGETVHWGRRDAGPRPAELLIFHQPPAVVVHRVIARRPGGSLRTKGDGRPGLDAAPVRPEDIVGVVERVEYADAVLTTTGAGARVYAWLAWTISVLGAGLFGAAARVDRLLGRLAPRGGDLRVLRGPAWWLQRAAQHILFALLFRACHPAAEG